MIKIDLHTHSVLSPDGGLTLNDYQKLLADKRLDCIAITDHDAIDFAIEAHNKLGSKIIVGQEITTQQGEIIGLFLNSKVKPHTDLKTAINEIKKQDGIVYIPHPLETVRKGLNSKSLNSILDDIDIIEAFNGRAFFQNKGPEATAWAKINNIVICSSSDAHGKNGIGASNTSISQMPTSRNLVKLLGNARLQTNRPPLHSLFYPKLNRLRGKLSLLKRDL